MPSNPMQRKVRNSFFLGILVMLIITIIIGGLVFVTILKPKMDKEKGETIAYVYRLKAGVNISSGEEIIPSMVESVEIPVTTNLTDFILAKRQDQTGKIVDIGFMSGYTSKVDLKEGTILTKSMLNEGENEISNSLRYVEYNMITMPTTLDVGSFIDIRLRLPNGQDLIVVSKKEIANVYGQTIGLNLTEDEILILNSAIVERYIITASELYMTTYVEPGTQTAAKYTYMPTSEVIALMNMDENIVAEARAALASLYAKQGVTEIRGQINTIRNQYGEAESNIEAGIQAQIEVAQKARKDYLSGLEGY